MAKTGGENEHKNKANKKGGRENKCEIIQILAKDMKSQLGIMIVKRGN